MSMDGPVCGVCLVLERDCRCNEPFVPPERDEDHLQSEFERYYGSPIVAWERWEAWQWAIDAFRASQSDGEVK
jgi:hypothetical protein